MLERLPAHADMLRYMSDADVADKLLAQYPSKTVVRNTRTGENVGVGLWVHPRKVSRGVGSIAKCPVLPEDSWMTLSHG